METYVINYKRDYPVFPATFLATDLVMQLLYKFNLPLNIKRCVNLFFLSSESKIYSISVQGFFECCRCYLFDPASFLIFKTHCPKLFIQKLRSPNILKLIDSFNILIYLNLDLVDGWVWC